MYLPQGAKKEMNVTVASLDPVPGFLKINRPTLVMRAVFKPVSVLVDSVLRVLSLVQVGCSRADKSQLCICYAFAMTAPRLVARLLWCPMAAGGTPKLHGS